MGKRQLGRKQRSTQQHRSLAVLVDYRNPAAARQQETQPSSMDGVEPDKYIGQAQRAREGLTVRGCWGDHAGGRALYASGTRRLHQRVAGHEAC